MSVTLAITLDNDLTYVSDISDVVPQVSGTVVTWTLPSVTYYQKNGFSIYLQVPTEPAYGIRHAITGTLSSSGPDSDYSDNNFNSEVMIAYQAFLPVIGKQSR